MSTDTRPADLPQRIVVDQHGRYWRDYGSHLSMPPVSDENVETEVVAVYVLPSNPAPVVEALRRLVRFVDESAPADFRWAVRDTLGEAMAALAALPAQREPASEDGDEYWESRIWTEHADAGSTSEVDADGNDIWLTHVRADARHATPELDAMTRLLRVASTVRRMIEDGHPNDPSWFRIMAERLRTVSDLTDAALMDGEDSAIAAAYAHAGDAVEAEREAGDDMCPNCVTPWKCNGPHIPFAEREEQGR